MLFIRGIDDRSPERTRKVVAEFGRAGDRVDRWHFIEQCGGLNPLEWAGAADLVSWRIRLTIAMRRDLDSDMVY